MGNIFKFSKGITFKIKFSFDKRELDYYLDKLNSFKILVKNEKGISKSLNMKIHLEERASTDNSIFNGLKNWFFGANVDEKYCKIPHIGYNNKLKKYKFIEPKEKMSDYIDSKKSEKLVVFYTPYKCVLVNRINTYFYYNNSVVETSNSENFIKNDDDYEEDEPQIITKFVNELKETIWLPTLNYFGSFKIEKTNFINIEDEEKLDILNKENENIKDGFISLEVKKEKEKKGKKGKKGKKEKEKEMEVIEKKELPGEKIAKQNLKDLKTDLSYYFNNLKIIGKTQRERDEYKDIIDISNLVYFINYFDSDKIGFKKKKKYLSTIKNLMADKNNKSTDGLDYFINFDEKRFKKVKYMYINNLVEIIRTFLFNKYLELKNKNFYFYDLTEHEKIRKRFFKPMNKDELIEKIGKHPLIKKRKNKYEKEKISSKWSFKENEPYPDIYKSDDSTSIKSAKTSESVKTVIEDLNIDQSMIETPDPSLLNNLQSYEIFYKKLILICQAFPFFINRIEKSEVNKKFNFLYTYYLKSRLSNKCFINSNIIQFNNAFETLCENLKNSNLNLSEFDKVNKGKKNISFGNIIYPNPIIVNVPLKSNWYERRKDDIKSISVEDKIFKRHEEKKTKIKILEEIKIPEKETIIEKKRPLTPVNRRPSSVISFLPKKVEEVKLLEKKDDKEEEEEELYSEDEKEEKKEEKEDTISIIEPDDAPRDLSKKSLEKLKKEDVNKSLEKVFRAMEMEQKDDKLLLLSEDQFSKQFDDCYKMSYDEDRKDEKDKGLPIKNLNKLSRNLSLNFYRNIVSLNRAFNRTCGIIAIDCFRAISIRDKIFIIILAASMANCFDYLEIPYSIVVFADFKFQYIIKR